MKHSFLLLILCAFIGLQTAWAQELAVSGKVTDGQNPLPGVNILVKGTSQGTVTDVNGNYKLNVPSDATLVYSYVGFTTMEVPVNGRSVIDVQMTTDIELLSEIVVIGYGTVEKEDATGSVTSVDAKAFNEGNMVSPQDLLVGRVAGVQVTTNGGAPGAGATIKIRGGSSLSASNDPLVVIDGVPVDSEGIAGMNNALSTINPNDIESFTILKDASATAIYGARASNGVIIITTKQGPKDTKLRLTYSGQMAINTIPETVDVFSADEFRSLVEARTQVEENAVPQAALDLLGSANTNWQEQIYETAYGFDHNLSAGGTYKDIPYRVSLGFSDQDGILKTSNFQRTTYTVNLNPTFFDNHLQVNLNYKGMSGETRFANQGAIGAAVTFDPTQPVFVDGSPWGGYFFWGQPTDPNLPIPIAPSNPVALLNLTNDVSDVNRYITNAQVNYRFHFLPELRANLNIAKDHSSSEGANIVSEDAAWTYSSFGNGRRTVYNQEKDNELLEFYLNYKKELKSIDSEIDLLGGYSWQHYKRSGESLTTTGDETHVFDSLDYASENYLVSFYSRLNYNLKDRYLLTVTLRNDGSSRFTEENRWGLFPSVAFAWKIKEESFLQNVDAISNFKLRLGYGVTGQENVGFPYPALARVTLGEPTAGYFFGDELIRTIRYEGYDANLKWEETTTYNAGIDFGLFNNRVSGSLDYYQRTTDDLLNVVPIPLGTNFTNRILTNVGSLENQGVEFALNATVIQNSSLVWDAGFNVTANTNKITKLTLVDDPDYLGVLTGGIGGGVGNTIQVHRVGHPANSFFVYEQVYDTNGDPIEGLYVDQNEDGIINDFDRIIFEDPAPKVFMGFNSNLSYKKFELSFNARMNLGNYVYNNVYSQYATYLNIYNSAGFINNLSPAVNESNFFDPQYISDFYIRDASFFRMDNITLAYNFGNVLSDNLGLYANFTVQNAFVITNYEGLDPEVAGGIDNNIYPRPRVYLFGLRANFNY